MSKSIPVFCIPHAGGMAYAYKNFRIIKDDILEYVPIDMSGHGQRMNENLYINFYDIVDDLYKELVLQIKDDFVLFGHSMGAWVAYELARKLRKEKGINPQLLILSSCIPPMLYENIIDMEQDDSQIVQQLIQRSNCLEKILEDEILYKTFFPIIKADFTAINEYVLQKFVMEKIDCNILVLIGNEEQLKSEDVEYWHEMTNGYIHYELLQGDHFAVYQDFQRVHKCIKKIMT